jgi:prevent-host-death family protein
MKTVNIHAAKTHFSRLVDRVAEGEEIVIARGGRPVARLCPLAPRQAKRRPGLMKGRIVISKDFDAPLPADVLDAFYGKPIDPSRARR